VFNLFDLALFAAFDGPLMQCREVLPGHVGSGDGAKSGMFAWAKASIAARILRLICCFTLR